MIITTLYSLKIYIATIATSKSPLKTLKLLIMGPKYVIMVKYQKNKDNNKHIYFNMIPNIIIKVNKRIQIINI